MSMRMGMWMCVYRACVCVNVCTSMLVCVCLYILYVNNYVAYVYCILAKPYIVTEACINAYRNRKKRVMDFNP